MRYNYSDGATNLGELDIHEIAIHVYNNPLAKHLVWTEGMSAWAEALSVPEIKKLVDAFVRKEENSPTKEHPLQSSGKHFADTVQAVATASRDVVEKISGQGKSSAVPTEVQGWNWGAFLLTWIWGIKHRVWISLLMIVPIANIVVWILLGLKGSQWAWQSRRWESVSAFKRSQRKWAIGGVITIPSILFLAVLVSLFRSPYEKSVELIKEKKYDEAKELLSKIPAGDSLAGRAKVAIVVCEIGALYQKNEYEKAQAILLRTDGSDMENSDDGFYVLNLPPSDPLFPHATALAHLVMGESMIRYWEKYKKDVDKGEYEEMGTGTTNAALWLKGVREGFSDAKYSEIDHVRADEDLFSVKYPPYLCSIGLKNLKVPKEWTAAVSDMISRLAKTEELRQEIDRQIESNASSFSTNDEEYNCIFGTTDEALQWLTEANGAWLSMEPHYNRDQGESVRIALSFKIGYGAESGEFIMGNVQAEKGFDVGNPLEGHFSVSSVDGCTVKINVRGINGNATQFAMQRTDNDHAMMNGDRAMIRVRKY